MSELTESEFWKITHASPAEKWQYFLKSMSRVEAILPHLDTPSAGKVDETPNSGNVIIDALRRRIDELESHIQFLEEHSTYQGGGSGGNISISFDTPLDSECFFEQLKAAFELSKKTL